MNDTTDNPFTTMREGNPAPTIQPRYRWKVPYLRFKVGDPVPDSYGSGQVRTLLAAGRVEDVEKCVTAPPADRMLRPGRGKVRTK